MGSNQPVDTRTSQHRLTPMSAPTTLAYVLGIPVFSLLLLLVTLAVVYFAYTSTSRAWFGSRFQMASVLLLFSIALVVCIHVKLSRRLLRSWWQQVPRISNSEEFFCRVCNYDLTGLIQQRCPECYQPFTLDTADRLVIRRLHKDQIKFVIPAIVVFLWYGLMLSLPELKINVQRAVDVKVQMACYQFTRCGPYDQALAHTLWLHYQTRLSKMRDTYAVDLTLMPNNWYVRIMPEKESRYRHGLLRRIVFLDFKREYFHGYEIDGQRRRVTKKRARIKT